MQLNFFSIVQIWSQVQNGRCGVAMSPAQADWQVEGASSHFHRPWSGRPFLSQLWFFVWFSDKLTIVELLPKVWLRKPQHKKFVKCIIVSSSGFLVWQLLSRLLLSMEIEDCRLKLPKCPKKTSSIFWSLWKLPRFCLSPQQSTAIPWRGAGDPVIWTFLG